MIKGLFDVIQQNFNKKCRVAGINPTILHFFVMIFEV